MMIFFTSAVCQTNMVHWCIKLTKFQWPYFDSDNESFCVNPTEPICFALITIEHDVDYIALPFNRQHC